MPDQKVVRARVQLFPVFSWLYCGDQLLAFKLRPAIPKSTRSKTHAGDRTPCPRTTERAVPNHGCIPHIHQLYPHPHRHHRHSAPNHRQPFLQNTTTPHAPFHTRPVDASLVGNTPHVEARAANSGATARSRELPKGRDTICAQTTNVSHLVLAPVHQPLCSSNQLDW